MLAPVVRGRKGEYDGLLKELAPQGFTRARVDGEIVELGSGDRGSPATRTTPSRWSSTGWCGGPGIERRLTDSLETALRLAEGVAEVEIVPRDGEADDDAETLTFSEHLACTHCGDRLRRARAAQLLVQLAVRRVRALRRARHPVRGRSRAGRPERRPLDQRGRDRGVGGLPEPLLRARARRRWPRRTASRSTRRGRSSRRARRRRCCYGTGGTPIKVSYRNRYGRQRSYTTQFEGVVPWLERRHHESESDRAREQIEGYMREVPCPACNGARLRPGVARGDDRRQEHLRGRRALDPQGGGVPRLARAVRARPDDRRARREGSQRAAALPARRRPRLPHAQPVVGHARRRRGAAHPARVADRQRPRRCALRARRAVDRSPPARQPAPDRHAAAPARSREHRDRRRARRGDHPRRRPRRRHRPGCGRARRRDRRGGHGEEAARRAAVDHRAVPRGQADHPDTRDAPHAERGVDHGPRRARAQPEEHRRRVPARVLRRGHRGERQRQEHARERHPLPRAHAEDLPLARRAGPSQVDRGHREHRQGHQHRPVADRPYAALEPGDLHRACSTRSARCSRPRRRRRCAATCRAGSRST